MKEKKKTPMEELTKGYEKFIKGKAVKKTGKKSFDKTLKTATKQRGSK